MMERNEMLNLLNNIFIDTLDDPEIIINENTQASDVDGWDSLTHIMLVVAVEKQFNIKFTSKEILAWQNVGDMMNCMLNK